jgi:hypothetical protein
MNGHPFDTKHTFRINRFTDIERYASIDETYVEPTVEEYRPKVWLPTSIKMLDSLAKGTSTSMAR